MEMFSISWLEALSYRMIPLGDTVNVTFCSFFPLALAWMMEEEEKSSKKKKKDILIYCEIRYFRHNDILI